MRESDEDTEVKDDSGVEQQGEQPELRQEESGESASALERLGHRAFQTDREALAGFRRALPSALPQRRSFRSVRTNSRGKLDLRRALRSIVRADGDVPVPPLRRRPTVSRSLLDSDRHFRLDETAYRRLPQARPYGRAGC